MKPISKIQTILLIMLARECLGSNQENIVQNKRRILVFGLTPYAEGWNANNRKDPNFIIKWLYLIGTATLLTLLCILFCYCMSFLNKKNNPTQRELLKTKVRESTRYNVGRTEDDPIDYRRQSGYYSEGIYDAELEGGESRSFVSPGADGYYGSNPYGPEGPDNYYSSEVDRSNVRPVQDAEYDIEPMDVRNSPGRVRVSREYGTYDSPRRGSPIYDSPRRGSPMYDSPRRGSPMYGSPMRGSPMPGSPMPGSPPRRY